MCAHAGAPLNKCRYEMKSRRTTAELRDATGQLKPKPACGPWRVCALSLSDRRACSCEPENHEPLPCDVPWAGMSVSSKRSSLYTPPQACRVNYKRRKPAVSRTTQAAIQPKSRTRRGAARSPFRLSTGTFQTLHSDCPGTPKSVMIVFANG